MNKLINFCIINTPGIPPISIKTEILAGITSFLTMVYIVFVNSRILHEAGLDQGAVFTATCLVSAFACSLSGLMANSPIGIAPGMAINIFFTYSVVKENHIDWHQALTMVFISGLIFFLVSITRLRHLFIDAIPEHLSAAVMIGISLLIALIALENNHIIVKGSETLLQLGKITSVPALLFLLGFLIILVLDFYQIPCGIMISILFISCLSFLLGFSQWHGFMALPPSLSPTFMQLDFSHLYQLDTLKITFTFFLISVFDASGTLIGLLNQSVFRNHPNIEKTIARSLTADAAASSLGGLLGTSSTSPFIESAAGIAAGGRTGLTAQVIALGFLLTLFFFPLAENIPDFAVGPALLYVACSMLRSLPKLKLTTIGNTAPSLLIIMMIPFTSSIADGIGSGMILYVLLKIFTFQKIQPLTFILSMIFMLFFMVS